MGKYHQSSPSVPSGSMHARAGKHTRTYVPQLEHLALEVLHELTADSQLLRPVIHQVRAHAREPAVSLLGVPVVCAGRGVGGWMSMRSANRCIAHRHSHTDAHEPKHALATTHRCSQPTKTANARTSRKSIVEAVLRMAASTIVVVEQMRLRKRRKDGPAFGIR